MVVTGDARAARGPHGGSRSRRRLRWRPPDCAGARGGLGSGVRLPSGLSVAAGQLVLLTYYLPALVRTAALAWRCARRIPVRYIDVGMRAVAVAAVAELALIAARADEIVAAVRGVSSPGAEAAGVGAAQGVVVIAVITGVTATAWFPLVESGMFQGLMWAAWWRLGSLHAALVRAAPEVRLPPEPGTRVQRQLPPEPARRRDPRRGDRPAPVPGRAGHGPGRGRRPAGRAADGPAGRGHRGGGHRRRARHHAGGPLPGGRQNFGVQPGRPGAAQRPPRRGGPPAAGLPRDAALADRAPPGRLAARHGETGGAPVLLTSRPAASRFRGR